MNTDQQIQQVLRRILVLNILVAVTKLTLGFSTGAISIIADGFHSLIDGVANIIAIVAQWIAAQPPDEDHPYGHRRFETLATLIIGGLMLLVAWEVLQAAIRRLINGDAPDVPPISFVILVGTLVINVLVVVYERHAARKYASRVLMADANHTLTDVLATGSVIISMGLVAVGIGWADGIAALLLVVLIMRIGWQIMNEAIQILVDAAPLKPTDVEQVVQAVPHVEKVLQTRSRSTGNAVHVDIAVQIPRMLSADHAHNIGTAVEDVIQDAFPDVAEVQVTLTPSAESDADSPMLRARAAADSLGLGVHEVIAIPSGHGLILEMHVEVQRGITLTDAHQQATILEEKLMIADDVSAVITHIEPASQEGAPLSQSSGALALRKQAIGLAASLYPNANWHDATIRLALGGYALTMHCHLPGQTSVEEAHHIAEQVETHIRAQLPTIQRVTIHTEPVPSDLV